jgi:hypothetical protein
MKKVAACVILSAAVLAQEGGDDCGLSPHPYTIDLRHIEGKGIGYDKGYTTLDMRFHFPETTFAPFIDLRGHLFDDEKWAANGGMGVRYLADSVSAIFGLNAYYDFRQAHRKDFQQVGGGLEVLWSRWELRTNGYFPISARKTRIFDIKFDEFKGNRIILKGKRDYSLLGGDAEVGVHLKNTGLVRCYAGIGPYYLSAEGCKDSWGGKGRFKVDISKWFWAEVNGSYDSIFKGIVQGQLALVVPFGPRSKVASKKEASCETAIALQERLVQQPERLEIIPIERCKKKSPAIDPLTGLPYTVWFVNNTSSSAGTIESPFPTLLQAQNASGVNDIIYVSPGNGSLYDGGIVLKDNQRLYGSGVRHIIPTQFGDVEIPQQTSTLPLIGNTMGTVVLLANNNTIEGLNIEPTMDVVNGFGINHLAFLYNQISPIGNSATVQLSDVTGQVTINNNYFFTEGTGGFPLIVQGIVDVNIDMRNNLIESCNTVAQFTPASGVLNLNFVNNTINGSISGISFGNSADCQGQIVLENNRFYASGVVFAYTLSQNARMGLTLLNNEFLGFSDFQITTFMTSQLDLNANGNTFVGQNQVAITATDNSQIRGGFDRNTVRMTNIGLSLIANASGQAFMSVTNNVISTPVQSIFASDTAATLCLRYQNNQMPAGTPVIFQQMGGSNFYLEPLIGNTGFLIPVNVITNVPSGFCE